MHLMTIKKQVYPAAPVQPRCIETIDVFIHFKWKTVKCAERQVEDGWEYVNNNQIKFRNSIKCLKGGKSDCVFMFCTVKCGPLLHPSIP